MITHSFQTICTGTLVSRDVQVKASYTIDFAGTGEAPAYSKSGTITETIKNLFADVEINTLDGVPQSIRSYSARSGHASVVATNEQANYKAANDYGFRESLRQQAVSTMNKNVKVVVNQAIQALKAAAAA